MKYIKLGSGASSFYDMSTGLNVTGKDIVAVKEGYLKSKRTARALQGGHLVYSSEDEYTEAKSGTIPSNREKKPMDMIQLRDKFVALWKSGKTEKEIADSFNKAEMIAMAESADLEVEDTDTKVTLATAIIEQMNAD